MRALFAFKGLPFKGGNTLFGEVPQQFTHALRKVSPYGLTPSAFTRVGNDRNGNGIYGPFDSFQSKLKVEILITSVVVDVARLCKIADDGPANDLRVGTLGNFKLETTRTEAFLGACMLTLTQEFLDAIIQIVDALLRKSFAYEQVVRHRCISSFKINENVLCNQIRLLYTLIITYNMEKCKFPLQE